MVVNEIGEGMRLTYDAVGRIAEEQSFDGRVRTFAYDPNGALARYTIGDRDTLEFSYDPCGRLIGRHLSDGSLEQYEYDLLGRLIAARNAQCTVTYAYDPLGNVIEERQDDVNIISDFDATGRLLQRRSTLGFDVRFSRDRNGRPVKIVLLGNNSFSFVYDAAGSEVSRSLPGGLRFAQDRDEHGRVIRQFVGSFSPKTTASDVEGFLRATIARSFRYDGNNAPTTITDRRLGTAAYTYDPAEQLISADYDSQKWERFEYTLTGGISRITSPSTDVRLEYGGGNRLLRAGKSEYNYDVSGRRIRKTVGVSHDGNWAYTWDSLGRLQSVTVPSGDIWTYSYDALGRRIAKAGPQGTTRFVWCGDTMLHAIGHNGDVESWLYDDASLVPIAKAENGRVYSIIPDHLGVPRELIDTNGTIAWSTKLSAWGSEFASSPSKVDCPIRFPGQWFDAESGLHYNRYRYFDPEIGQFISQDPIGIDGGLNLYRYAPNSLNYIDLLGLDICANRKKGEDFKNAVKDELEKAGFTVVDEVTIRVDAPDGAVRTRVDLLVFDQHGNPVLIETKASATAPYTPNQTAAGVPGGTLSGPAEFRTDKGGLSRGGAVPTSATTVTVRPGDPIPGTGPPPVTAPHPPPP
jgi:RHS repeat-associated protein